MSSVLRTILVRSQRHLKLTTQTRTITRSPTSRDKPIPIEKPVVITPVKEAASSTPAEGESSGTIRMRLHPVNSFEKRLLVWSGKFKSIDEVPNQVAEASVERARSSARIKIANYMILATIIGCFIAIVSGKNARARGESVAKSNREWHKQVNEEWQAEKAAKAAQAEAEAK